MSQTTTQTTENKTAAQEEIEYSVDCWMLDQEIALEELGEELQ